jgi:hypothetical protein
MAELAKKETVLAVIREKYPDANEREAWAVEMLIAVHQYLPETLTRLSTGKPTAVVINEWLTETYDLKITYPERKPKARRTHANIERGK